MNTMTPAKGYAGTPVNGYAGDTQAPGIQTGLYNRSIRPWPSQNNIARPLLRIRSGRILFVEDDEGDDVFHLVKGSVSFSHFMPDERRVICGFALEGELFSFSNNGRRCFSAETLADCLYRRLTSTELEAMRKSDDPMQRAVIAYLQSEPWIMQFQALQRLHLSADDSVAYFICEIGKRTNVSFTNGSRIRLDMSRADISAYLGITVETVVRALKRLAVDGVLIAYSPHEYCVRDLARLHRWAGVNRN